MNIEEEIRITNLEEKVNLLARNVSVLTERINQVIVKLDQYSHEDFHVEQLS